MTISTIGSDIEVFLAQGDSIISAIDMIGGTKHEPFMVDHGNLQEDNVLAEFAIDPVRTCPEFIRNIREVMGSLRERVNGLELKALPSAEIPMEALEDPRAAQFGCDPDYNGWTLERNTPPNPEEVGNLRSAGGHIHIGYDNPDLETHNLIRWMDVMLGVPSVILDPDMNRRKLYGKAGSYRSKEYGVEYRVLSNFWIQTEELMQWVYNQTYIAYDNACRSNVVEALGTDTCQQVIESINNSDLPLAWSLVQKLAIEFPNMEEVANA